MSYTKNTWIDQDVERPKTYEVTNNQDGSITLTDSFGLVTELGTPVNAVNMNHIEDGIDGCAIRKHNLTETFALGEWVLGGTGDDEGIYKSLIANNVGNALTDGDAWEKVKMGGASGRNVGEIISSTLPLTDAGLHLLDGGLIQGGGIYQGFVDYIADLYYNSSGSSEIRTNPIMTSNTTPYGTASYTGTLYSTSQPFAMLAGNTSSTAWTTDSGSVTYTYDVAQQPLTGTYRFYFRYGSYDASGRSLNNVVITVTYEDNTTSTINVGNLTGPIHAIDSQYVTSEFTTSKKIKSFTLSHSGSSINITTMNIGNFQLQRMVSNYFCNESQWQKMVYTYGSCGKFVYDSTNNTVRLPKVTGKIDGTTDLNALGDLEPLFVRLPNITGSFHPSDGIDTISSGCVYDTISRGYGEGSGTIQSFGDHEYHIDASRSSSVYSGNGTDTTIHEQAINVLLYIVIATSTKTDVQVDIDEVVTDLNGKADVDLTNVTNTGYIKMAGAGMPSDRYIDLTLGASGSAYTAPANGWFTAQILNPIQWSNFSLYNTISLLGYTLAFTTNPGTTDYYKFSIPAKKGDIIRVHYTGTKITFRFIYAQGSESEAQ